MKKQFLIMFFCVAALMATLAGCHKPDYRAQLTDKVMADLAATGGAVATIDTLAVHMNRDTAVVDVRALLQMEDAAGIHDYAQNLQYVFVKNGDDFNIISKTKGRPKPAVRKADVQ